MPIVFRKDEIEKFIIDNGHDSYYYEHPQKENTFIVKPKVDENELSKAINLFLSQFGGDRFKYIDDRSWVYWEVISPFDVSKCKLIQYVRFTEVVSLSDIELASASIKFHNCIFEKNFVSIDDLDLYKLEFNHCFFDYIWFESTNFVSLKFKDCEFKNGLSIIVVDKKGTILAESCVFYKIVRLYDIDHDNVIIKFFDCQFGEFMFFNQYDIWKSLDLRDNYWKVPSVSWYTVFEDFPSFNFWSKWRRRFWNCLIGRVEYPICLRFHRVSFLSLGKVLKLFLRLITLKKRAFIDWKNYFTTNWTLYNGFRRDEKEMFLKMKFSFQVLKSYYSYKNQEYEVSIFQRSLNHLYLNERTLPRIQRYALFWSRLSNDFGTNYLRALIFTIILSVVSVITVNSFLYLNNLILFDFSLKGFTLFWVQVIKMLQITNWKIEFYDIQRSDINNGLLYDIIDIVVYFFRLFIGFGIYQFIVAFRRSSKF